MTCVFTIKPCEIDFSVMPYLKIDRNNFVSISSQTERERLEREFELMLETLANQTDIACSEREECATVYKLPLRLSNDSEGRYDPVGRLLELCGKVNDSYAVYVGYKKYTFEEEIYYCPQLRLACEEDETFGEFTMYDIVSVVMNGGKPQITQRKGI